MIKSMMLYFMMYVDIKSHVYIILISLNVNFRKCINQRGEKFMGRILDCWILEYL